MRKLFFVLAILATISVVHGQRNVWSINPQRFIRNASQVSLAKNNDDYLNLAKKFAPEVRLHREEKHFPSSVDWFLQRACLVHRMDKNPNTNEVFLGPPLKINDILNKEKAGVPSSTNKKKVSSEDITGFYLQIVGEETKRGERPLGAKIIKTACYVRFIEPPYSPTLDIQYWFFYPFNSQHLSFTPFDKTGEHQGDWEHVTVRLNRERTEIVGVFFARHGMEGKWEDFSYVSGTQHPIVYSAKDSHASYPKAANHRRPRLRDLNKFTGHPAWDIFYPILALPGPFLNKRLPTDLTSEGGAKWKCWENLILLGEIDRPLNGQNWIQFTGRWGGSEGGIGGFGKSPQTLSFKPSWFTEERGGPWATKSDVLLEIKVHLQSLGDRTYRDGQYAGTRDENRRLEGFSIKKKTNIPGITIWYKAHLQDLRDTRWMREGEYCGTKGAGKRLEGFQIKLEGRDKHKYDVIYKAHIQDYGDSALHANGAFCGTKEKSKRIEGISVIIRRK